MPDILRRHESIKPGRSPTKPCPNPKCGNWLYLTDHECFRCGTIIPKEDRTPTNLPCPHCREFIPVDSTYCPKCGAQVYKQPEPEPPPPPKPKPKPRPTMLPPDGWKFPITPAHKISAPSKPKAPAPPSPTLANNPSATATDNSQVQSLAPLPSSHRVTIGWVDAFKISIAVAVAPFIHALLVNIFQISKLWICAAGPIALICP